MAFLNFLNQEFLEGKFSTDGKFPTDATDGRFPVEDGKSLPDQSRDVEFDPIINDDNFRHRRIQEWYTAIGTNTMCLCMNEHQYDLKSTLNSTALECAGNVIKDFLDEKYHEKVNILDIGSGNRCATKIVTDIISCYVSGIKTTDIIHYPTKNPEIEFDLVHSVDAVSKYGGWADVLLLICPHAGEVRNPYTCGDYYACHDFILRTHQKENLIIFIGELGASCGTEGMYKYLLENPRLNLCKRKLVYSRPLCGGNADHEVFIFRIIKQ